MYQGRNPTALTSQQWLVDALLALMEQKDYAHLSVREICNAAGLSRQTFYNCFGSKEEILRFRIRQCYQEMLALLNQAPRLRLADITDAFAVTFQNNHSFFRLLLDQHLESVLHDELSRAIDQFTGRLCLDIPKHRLTYGSAFLSGGISNTVIWWFKDPDPLSSKELAALLADMLAGNYYDPTHRA